MKKEIGSKIRQIRELKGYSQEYLASKLGVSQKAYSNIETNQTRVDWEKLTRIADVLEVKPTDIISFDDNLIFHNCSQSGKFESFINNMPKKLIEQYELRITGLENEISFLRKIISDIQVKSK